MLCYTLTPKHVQLFPDVFFQFHMEERWGMDVQTRCDRYLKNCWR